MHGFFQWSGWPILKNNLKQIVRKEDPQAFVVVSDTTEVMGHRIGNQPHW